MYIPKKHSQNVAKCVKAQKEVDKFTIILD